jgi:dihydroorotate dehydrogenase
VLVVSVVGTQDTSLSDPQQSLDALADDFAKCARWAVNSGAHGIEANFSCPNVSTADGQLFQNPQLAAIVAQRIRDAIGDAPLVIKIGKVNSAEEAAALVDALSPFINGLAMTNSISATVVRPDGTLHFDGQPRGICGDATRTASIGQTQLFADVVRQQSLPLDLIGVGGISTAAHVQDYLNAGATSVAMATSAMINPLVAFSIRGEMASHASQLQ